MQPSSTSSTVAIKIGFVQYLSMYISLLKMSAALPPGPDVQLQTALCYHQIGTAAHKLAWVPATLACASSLPDITVMLAAVPWLAVLGRVGLYTAKLVGEVALGGVSELPPVVQNLLAFVSTDVLAALEVCLHAPGYKRGFGWCRF